jgi:hypothetical protein
MSSRWLVGIVFACTWQLGVVCCGFACGGGRTVRRVLGVLLPDNNFQFPCMLTETCLPHTGAEPSDPGRKSMELSMEVETNGAWALLGLWRLTMVRVPHWRSSSPALVPLQSDRKARKWFGSSSCVLFLFLVCLSFFVSY